MKYISNIAHLNKMTKEVVYHRIKIIELFDEFVVRNLKNNKNII